MITTSRIHTQLLEKRSLILTSPVSAGLMEHGQRLLSRCGVVVTHTQLAHYKGRSTTKLGFEATEQQLRHIRHVAQVFLPETEWSICDWGETHMFHLQLKAIEYPEVQADILDVFDAMGVIVHQLLFTRSHVLPRACYCISAMGCCELGGEVTISEVTHYLRGALRHCDLLLELEVFETMP